ncbi:MAG: hypothetical protein AAGF25_13565 [Pseudomonadota bacterium]
MTKTMTSGPQLSRNYTLIIVFDQLKRYVGTMKKCCESEATKFYELLNEIASWVKLNKVIKRKRIEVETHLIPLEMALMLGNLDVIKRCKLSLCTAIEQLQAACLSTEGQN